MRKPTKRPDLSARAGNTIPLVVTSIVESNPSTAANQEGKRGKLNYQAKPLEPQKAKPKTPSTRRMESKSYATGRFIGDGEKLTAFVWLDDENVPEGKAANE